jgi:glycosyltransferase involved in cell wall biosynthesis
MGDFIKLNYCPSPKEIWDVRGIRALRSARFVLANSEFTRDKLMELTGFAPDMIYPPLIEDKVKVPDELAHKKKKWIFLPSGQPLKGLDIFIGLAKAFPKEHFLVSIPDWIREHSKRYLPSPLPKNVTIIGWDNNIKDIYAETKVMFIGTKTCETFSRTAAEARLNGIPLLTSDVGNFKNIVPCGGLMLPFDAPQSQWNEALRKLLNHEVEIEQTNKYATHDTYKILDMLDTLTLCDKVLLVNGGGPGVKMVAVNLSQMTGAEVCSLPEAQNKNLEGYQCVIILGGLCDAHAKLLNDHPKAKFAFYWCSNFTQMTFDPHELKWFFEILKDYIKRPNVVGFFTTDKRDVRALRSLCGEKIYWLPAMFNLQRTMWINEVKDSGFNVSIMAPYHHRKNMINTFIACKLADVKTYICHNVLMHPAAIDTVKAIGLSYEKLTIPDQEKFQEHLARQRVAIANSAAETYCYFAIENMLVGTPVIGNKEVPSLNYEDEELQKLWVPINDIDILADKINWLKTYEGYDELCEKSKLHALNYATECNREAIKMLKGFLNGLK